MAWQEGYTNAYQVLKKTARNIASSIYIRSIFIFVNTRAPAVLYTNKKTKPLILQNITHHVVWGVQQTQ